MFESARRELKVFFFFDILAHEECFYHIFFIDFFDGGVCFHRYKP